MKISDALTKFQTEQQQALQTAVDRARTLMERWPDLPEPTAVYLYLWPLLTYQCPTPDAARDTVLSIQRATGLLMAREVDAHTGNVTFVVNQYPDYHITVTGAALSPACRLVQEAVEVPARTELRYRVVCDDEEGTS